MNYSEDAVSPVVGVMLMLVVTIIIAAVVAAFSGGLGSDSSSAPIATLKVTPVIEAIEDTDKTNWEEDYPAGFSADNGLLFEHNGGDSFDLSDIKVQLQYLDTKTTIGLDDTFAVTNCTSSGNYNYLAEIGTSDNFIQPGDKFMLYSDNCRIDDVPSWGYNNAKQISWEPDGSESGFALYLNKKCEYKIIDRISGKVIQQGDFVLTG